MLGWKVQIDIKQHFDLDRQPIEIGKAIARELTEARPRVEFAMRDEDDYTREMCLRQLDEIISLVEDDDTTEDLDGRLNELYDWGDEYRVLLNGREPESYGRVLDAAG